MRIRFQELLNGCFGQLDPNSLLVQEDAQLLADVPGREAEHLTQTQFGAVDEQVFQSILFCGVELRNWPS